jgi:hypothetical protein
MTANHISEALLSQRLLREARWRGKDKYPSTSQYFRELEGLLGFIQAHGRLDSYWPRLVSERPQQRDDALQEIRVARFLTTNGFPVLQWEPPGNGNLTGEFTVQALPSAPTFVEVKCPGWEGELNDEERAAGRKDQGKYGKLEGRAVGPSLKIRESILKAYPKFLPNQPSLLVIADDFFVPLASWGDLPADGALFLPRATLGGEPGSFTTARFENLGGLAFFKQEVEVDLLRDLSDKPLRYEFALYLNPMARPETSLPRTLVDAFQRSLAAH